MTTEKRMYGQWAGDEKGVPEDSTRCIETVWPKGPGAGWVPHQCLHKRGYGPDGLYCKQHAKSHGAKL